MKPEDLTPTGREVPGAAMTLVEYVHDGHYSTGIRWSKELGKRHEVESIVARSGEFLRSPMVEGVVELDLWQPHLHELVYPTGRVWSLGELLALAHSERKQLGVRAGLELAYVGALLLQQGSEPGEGSDVPMHSNPNPWRWMLDREGELHLIGWGIPPLELYAQDADPKMVLPAPCYQYLAPERLQGADEDFSSDLFALTLIAAECMTGQPIYSTDPEDAHHEADHADASRNLYQWREKLPSDVRTFMSRALAQYRDGRFEDIEDYVSEAHNLLYSPLTEGPSLAEIVERWAPTEEVLGAASAPQPDDNYHAPSVAPEAGPRWHSPRRSAPVRRDRSHSSSRPVRKMSASTTDAKRRLRRTRDTANDPLTQSLRRSMDERPHHPRRHRALRDRNSLFPRQDVTEPTRRFLFKLPSGETAWARLSTEETLALSAARVADKACPSPIDATGQVTGWFRITQGDSAWYGDALTHVLDAENECRLRFVRNRLITASLRIEGFRDEPIEFAVGTAIVARFIVSALRNTYDLQARDWELWADEHGPMNPWQILDDYDPHDGAQLVMRRGSRRRSVRRR